VEASTDPMIVAARKMDPSPPRTDQVDRGQCSERGRAAGEQLGKARFAAYGKTTYPDATFTLRLSYGQMKGYPMNGTQAPYKTTFNGLYDRAQSFDFAPPFNLPSRYSEARSRLDLATPLDFVSTNDIVAAIPARP